MGAPMNVPVAPLRGKHKDFFLNLDVVSRLPTHTVRLHLHVHLAAKVVLDVPLRAFGAAFMHCPRPSTVSACVWVVLLYIHSPHVFRRSVTCFHSAVVELVRGGVAF